MTSLISFYSPSSKILIRWLDWYNLYWKSDKQISRICEMVQQMINYDTKRKQSN
jgi:hypothetical protein